MSVSAPSPSGVSGQQCLSLLEQLPDQVAGQQARRVEPEQALAGAWGDPPIVLRCGVPKPALLKRDSACFVVNSVGWLAVQGGRPETGTEPVTEEITFTTIGRSPYVELRVPPDYQPAADALVDISAAVSQATTELRPCL